MRILETCTYNLSWKCFLVPQTRRNIIQELTSQTRGGYSQKNWVGVCGPLPKTLTLFMTKICDFPYPIYDLTKNLIPYFVKGFCC